LRMSTLPTLLLLLYRVITKNFRVPTLH
jgi:hypothetical protein